MTFKFNIKILISLIATIFVFFPYTMIIPTNFYTQPYAIIFSFLAFLLNINWIIKYFPKNQFYLLLSLLLLGITVFIISCFPYNIMQDYKSLLSYISPLFFASLSYYLFVTKPEVLKKIILVTTLIWIITSLIQILIPGFASSLVGTWSTAGELNFLSGRGSMGLAPEPTHNGFHLIFLAVTTYLVGLDKKISVLCLLVAVLVAKSASALLVIILASFFYLLYKKKKYLMFILICGYLVYEIFIRLFLDYFDDNDQRYVFLIKSLIENPFDILQLDYSVNQRIGGIIIGFKELFNSFFLPNGISNNSWIIESEVIVRKYSWSKGISSSGIPSGFLNLFYQSGFFSIIIISFIIKQIFKLESSKLGTYLLICFSFVFLGQYMLSNPGFGFTIGLIYGKLIINKRNLITYS
jgi:hypothetical protein